MTTLVTTEGTLIPAGGGPYQTTVTGRQSLPVPSVPLWSMFDAASLQLVGEGRTVSFAELYRTQTWVSVVVDKIARQIARLPLKVYEIDSQGARRRVREHRLVDLLERPAPRQSATALKQWLALPALIHGNAVVGMYRPRPGSPPTRLWPLEWPALAAKQAEKGGPIAWWETVEFGDRVFVDAEDAIHIAWHAPTGRLGVSPLQKLSVPLRLEDAAQRYQEAMFRNGARPPSAIEASEEFLGLDRDERQALLATLREDITSLYAGPDNAGRPALLPPGLKWNPVGHTAVEAALVEQRRLTREEIAAVYDMPPPLVGILDHATYSNVSEMHRMLFTTVLGPWLTLFEETLQAQLINPEPAFEGLFVEFDLAEVLKGDKLKELQALQTGVDSGLLAINEGRDVLNLPRISDEDLAALGSFDIPRHQADRQQGAQQSADSSSSQSASDQAFQPTT